MTVFCLTLSISGHLYLCDVSPEGMYCTCDALASQQVQVRLTSHACLVIKIYRHFEVMLVRDVSLHF